MRMKNRFLRMGKTLFGAMCLLSLTGLTYSCSDDYDLDETMPPHLGGSLYDELKARNFTTMVNLIDDLGDKEVLSTTGSKTIFAADDEAYKAFFAKSGWIGTDGNPVRDYSNLTTSQKKLLLNGCMLNSSYVLEMLSNTEGGGKNLCLRQTCSAWYRSVRCPARTEWEGWECGPFLQMQDLHTLRDFLLPKALMLSGRQTGSFVPDLFLCPQWDRAYLRCNRWRNRGS